VLEPSKQILRHVPAKHPYPPAHGTVLLHGSPCVPVPTNAHCVVSLLSTMHSLGDEHPVFVTGSHPVGGGGETH
jgi:hypothetical protein